MSNHCLFFFRTNFCWTANHWQLWTLKQLSVTFLDCFVNRTALVWTFSACWFWFQAQTGWLQHDFGHLSVFKKSKWDHFFHYLTIGIIKVTIASPMSLWYFLDHLGTLCLFPCMWLHFCLHVFLRLEPGNFIIINPKSHFCPFVFFLYQFHCCLFSLKSRNITLCLSNKV